MADLPPQIGRYEIKSLIGRGGMGDLYLARDPNTGRLVALKLLNATLDSVELRERFAREARALAALNHPNIVNIYDTGEYDGAPFIVMEYVRGETLAEIIKRRARLSVARKLELMIDLCAGLAQAHNADIIHRDIKPANLMVDQHGRLKILDFGIARVTEEHRAQLGPLTQVDMMIGTPGYMSPEQIEGGAVDHRSDLFAVGAVCYELLAYSEAFGGDDTQQMDRRVRSGQIVPLSKLVPGIDPELDAIVQRALKRDPNSRFQDASTFEKALERVRARLGPEPAIEPARPTPAGAQGPGGRTRSVKAEAAYDRAVAAMRGGSLDAARRFAVETLAEDAAHAGARGLLARLDNATPGSTQVAAPGETLASDAAPGATAVGTSADFTRTGADETAVGQPRADTSSTFASAPTIIVPQGATNAVRRPSPRPPSGPSPRPSWSSGEGEAAHTPPAMRGGSGPRALDRPSEPFWLRYRTALGIGVPIAAVLIIALVIVLARSSGASTKLLTITRPTGGTIFGPGIHCGSRGEDCSATPRAGDAIALTVEADPDYTFNGYTGDCAAGGRAYMDMPRTCGATFVAADKSPASGPTQVLTIAPVPTGGTLEGVDISCGSKGSQCSATPPDGVTIELQAHADDGFTFMGFKGDCAPTGRAQMAGPRTCSAVFSLISQVSSPPTVAGGGGRGRGPTARIPVPTPVPTPSPSPPPPPTAPPPGARVVDPKTAQPVVAPQTDDDFAKGKIQEALKTYCDAEQQLSPEGVQSVYPKIDIQRLRRELNPSRYKSVKCVFSDVIFQQLDAAGGKATVQAALKQTYEHTIQTQKPEVSELVATLSFYRGGDRGLWLIENMKFVPK